MVLRRGGVCNAWVVCLSAWWLTLNKKEGGGGKKIGSLSAKA